MKGEKKREREGGLAGTVTATVSAFSNHNTAGGVSPLILLRLLVQALTCSRQRFLDPGVCLNLVACRVGEQNEIIRLR